MDDVSKSLYSKSGNLVWGIILSHPVLGGGELIPVKVAVSIQGRIYCDIIDGSKNLIGFGLGNNKGSS